MRLEESLKDAGVDTNRALLLRAAEGALRSSKWKHDTAIKKLLAQVNTDARLLRALHQLCEDRSRELASALLLQLIDDAKGPKREGVSQSNLEGHEVEDHLPPAPLDSSRASQVEIVCQTSRDRPAAPISKGGASQRMTAIQVPHDRPSRSISTSAARSVAQSSVFDKRVVDSFDHRWGDITQRDFLNLRIRNAFSKGVECGLAELNWPDMDTPIRKFSSEAKIARIASAAERDRQNAVAAVRALTEATHAQ